MEIRWKHIQLGNYMRKFVLARKLKVLAEAPIVETPEGIFLQPLATHKAGSFFSDRTGYEAFINKIHISDYIDKDETQSDQSVYPIIQAILYLKKIHGRLSNRPEKFRILLSLDNDSDEITVRFFMLRPNEHWGPEPENINDYALEDIIIFDT